MPHLRLTASGPSEKNPVAREYDVELTDKQWEQYSLARRDGRLHVSLDTEHLRYVIAESVLVNVGDLDGEGKEGPRVKEKGHVIVFGHMKPATGTVDNKEGKRIN